MANTTLTPKQAKNLSKRLRLARATTGHEQMKHYIEIDKMIKRYDLVIPEMKEISFEEQVIESVDDNRESRWNRFLKRRGHGKKIFYRHNELWGWRFYVKAILNLDFPSLFGHIKRVYFQK